MSNAAAAGVNDGVARLMDLFKVASPEQKQMIRDSLGVGGVIKKKNRRSTQDARMFVNRFGDVVHQPGFQVAPPSNVVDKGPRAVAGWMARREENMGTSEADLDQIVQSAKE